MLLIRALQYFMGTTVLNQSMPNSQAQKSLDFPNVAFLDTWSVLGPFPLGTREATWGADPLERHGGFRSLHYNTTASFRSALATDGLVRWTNATAKTTVPETFRSTAEINISFPDFDWSGLRDIYGWAANQWQTWARGQIVVQGNETETLALFTPQLLEFWIDDVHYFGGDFYQFQRAPVTLRLSPGTHQIDLRLARDVRSTGGVGVPDFLVNLELHKIQPELNIVLQNETLSTYSVLMADFIGDDATLSSPYASVVLRNDGTRDVEITGVQPDQGFCRAELLSSPVKLVPGQTRPIAFLIRCISPNKDTQPLNRRIHIDFRYGVDGGDRNKFLRVGADPRIVPAGRPHKVTFLHPGGVVSYAILRPPSQKAIESAQPDQKFPILLGLHGAGVEIDSDEVKEWLDPVPDLQAWLLFPTGGTPWSGDDWHAWGLADVEAAVSSVGDWIERHEWKGPGANLDRWLVVGHSNGGQGTWYVLTHRPDKVFAAAPISGYSSIQNYVPYTFTHVSDPGRTAILQSALLSYKHELLLPNAKGIPVLQQHGSADDNVPVYHSRLMSQLIQEAGADSEYFEVPSEPHYWEGIFTTKHLQRFYKDQIYLELAEGKKRVPISLRETLLVSANPADTGSKNGVEIMKLATPGQLGRIDVEINPDDQQCLIRSTNLRQFKIPSIFNGCEVVQVDGQNVPIISTQSKNSSVLRLDSGEWNVVDHNETVPEQQHQSNPMGTLDAILRTKGAFSIVDHSSTNATSHTTLQIARNLHQYFFADTLITDDYETAARGSGNIISIAVGDDLPSSPVNPSFAVQVRKGRVLIRGRSPEMIRESKDLGLAAVFLRPLLDGALELVVWGSDEQSLPLAARLVPMVTGVGQPEFIVTNREMSWKGVEGTLALGFFDERWEVSKNSFFA